MAWIHKSENNVLYSKEELITMPGTTATGYTSVIDFLDFLLKEGRSGYIEVAAHPSAITGSDLDISLYGSYTLTGTKYQLLDTIVVDLSVDDVRVFGSVAIWQYPFPYYWIGFLTDTDESANTISFYITAGGVK